MASQQDTQNRKSGSSQSSEDFNLKIANSQRDKTNFRAHKTAASADPFASGRLNIQEDRY